MSRKKRSTAIEEPDHDLLRHIHGLGLRTVEEYREWCVQNGFGRKLKKHWKLRCRERFHSQQAVAQERLDQRKREKRKLGDVLIGICDGQLGVRDVTQPHLQRLCEFLRTGQGPKHERQVNRKSLARLLSHLQNCRAKFFDDSPVIGELGELPGNTHIEALALVAAHSGSWLRPVEDWATCDLSSSPKNARPTSTPNSISNSPNG